MPMAEEEQDDINETSKLPSSRLARTAKFGSLVGGQSAKWAATSAINRLRTEERADEATQARAFDLADQLVKQLGQMKGAAMKIGQVLSTVDFELIPEGDREEFKERLAQLRDSAPQVAFKDMKKVVEADFGEPISAVFASFDEEPIAAASIGQVYRATTHDGDEVAVKVQYPGVAEAVETDMRNVQMLVPLLKRLAPGIDAKALLAELRERIIEELDYELEAANQRQIARAYRGHPFVRIPAIFGSLSTRRVLVSEYVEGQSFAQLKERSDEERDLAGEIAFRFFFGLLMRERLALGDPHPGNYIFCDDGRVCFLDFGLIRRVPEQYLDGERALARSVIEGDAEQTHRWLSELGYLPQPDEFHPERVLEQLQNAGEWYFTTGYRRLSPEYVRNAIEVGSSPRSPHYDYMRKQTLPPEALLMRRMEGLLFSVLGELRAGGDWGRLALEYIAAEPPSTPLGEQDADFFAARA
ncbi:MAG: AarF/ABC1/UbiB kinase family protein [Solirubrobacteraceae bacterium]|nr:AarF/ABC1/UbiB kinase family protein [Solirubrobacteraceae bacterium]MBJ7343371.1 AarF/ABC1/UbiB kinase family protein [Solirubrobacteraceae bacterium]